MSILQQSKKQHQKNRIRTILRQVIYSRYVSEKTTIYVILKIMRYNRMKYKKYIIENFRNIDQITLNMQV